MRLAFNTQERIAVFLIYIIGFLVSILDLLTVWASTLLASLFLEENTQLKTDGFFQGLIASDNYVLTLLLTVFTLRSLFRAARIFIEVRLTRKLKERVTSEIFKSQIINYDITSNKSDSANLIRDLTSVQDFLQAYVFSRFVIFEESILIVGVILVLAFNSPVATLIVLSLGTLAIYSTVRITGRKIEQAGREYVTHQATHIKFYSFIFRSIKEIFVYGKRESATESFELNLSKVTRAEQRFELTHKISPIATESIIVSLAIFTLWVAKTASDGNALSLSFAMILATGAFRLLPSLGRVSSVFQVRKFEKSQAQILFEYLDSSSPSTDLSHTTHLQVRNFNGVQITQKHPTNPTNVRIDLKNVSFSYSPNKPQVISNLSYTFETGLFHVIRGVSGIGKSTLLHLIMGYQMPQTGEILINQAPVRASQIFCDHQIAYVPQVVTALDFSLSENITLQFGRNEAIDVSKLQSAIVAAGLSEFVKSLPEGTRTPLGESGSKVSSGQLQRIGLARALYRDSRILLLDEATSNLDYETEAKILSDLNDLKDHRLVILVSHSSHVVKFADKLLEL